MKLRVKVRKYSLWLIAFSCCWLLISPSIVDATEETNSNCIGQSLEKLTDQLLIDLPSYSNRIIQTSRHLDSQADLFPYILIADKPEFQPLPLNSFEHHPEYESPDVKQVFFTTLERQYLNQKARELQRFHWLFLAKNGNGWHFVMMYSATGQYPAKQPIAPLEENNNGAVAVGIKNWLRDCAAGSTRKKAISSG
jgi:hypothetical protein